MKNRRIFGIMIAAMLSVVALAAALRLFGNGAKQTFFAKTTEGYTVILDAGHGGVDGGAVSKTGLAERELTLSIAKQAQAFLQLSGVRVILTRTDNGDLHEENALTLKEQKRSDLKNRAQIAQKYPQAMLISIHLNSFPQEEQHGAQVFFKGDSRESKALGLVAQQTLAEALDPQNARVAKAIPNTIYLFRNIGNTAILAECGFLSNPDEAAKLGTEEYREQVAFALWLTVMRYIEET